MAARQNFCRAAIFWSGPFEHQWLLPLHAGAGIITEKDRLNAISYDAANHAYLRIGERVGTAFADGKQLR